MREWDGGKHLIGETVSSTNRTNWGTLHRAGFNRMFFPRSPLIDGATRMRTTR